MSKRQAHTHIHVQTGLRTGQVALATEGEGGRLCGQQREPGHPDALAGGGPRRALLGIHWWASGKGQPGAETSSWEGKGCGGRLAPVGLSSRQSVRLPCLLIILPGLKPECLG